MVNNNNDKKIKVHKFLHSDIGKNRVNNIRYNDRIENNNKHNNNLLREKKNKKKNASNSYGYRMQRKTKKEGTL